MILKKMVRVSYKGECFMTYDFSRFAKYIDSESLLPLPLEEPQEICHHPVSLILVGVFSDCLPEILILTVSSPYHPSPFLTYVVKARFSG